MQTCQGHRPSIILPCLLCTSNSSSPTTLPKLQFGTLYVLLDSCPHGHSLLRRTIPIRTAFVLETPFYLSRRSIDLLRRFRGLLDRAFDCMQYRSSQAAEMHSRTNGWSELLAANKVRTTCSAFGSIGGVASWSSLISCCAS